MPGHPQYPPKIATICKNIWHRRPRCSACTPPPLLPFVSWSNSITSTEKKQMRWWNSRGQKTSPRALLLGRQRMFQERFGTDVHAVALQEDNEMRTWAQNKEDAKRNARPNHLQKAGTTSAPPPPGQSGIITRVESPPSPLPHPEEVKTCPTTTVGGRTFSQKKLQINTRARNTKPILHFFVRIVRDYTQLHKKHTKHTHPSSSPGLEKRSTVFWPAETDGFLARKDWRIFTAQPRLAPSAPTKHKHAHTRRLAQLHRPAGQRGRR